MIEVFLPKHDKEVQTFYACGFYPSFNLEDVLDGRLRNTADTEFTQLSEDPVVSPASFTSETNNRLADRLQRSRPAHLLGLLAKILLEDPALISSGMNKDNRFLGTGAEFCSQLEQLDLENMLVEEQECRKRLRLRTGGYAPVFGQPSQKILYFLTTHLHRMTLFVKQDKQLIYPLLQAVGPLAAAQRIRELADVDFLIEAASSWTDLTYRMRRMAGLDARFNRAYSAYAFMRRQFRKIVRDRQTNRHA